MSAEQKNTVKMILSAVSGGVVIWVLTLIFNGGGFIATTNESVRETKTEFKEHVKNDYEFQTNMLVKITAVESNLKTVDNSVGELKQEVRDYLDFQKDKQKKAPEF